MITKVRVAYPSIVVNGTDYYKKLEPYFLDLAYTDNCDGEKADDLHLKLADRDNRFISDWMPAKGEFLDIGIITERWYSPLATLHKLDCGRLWIDEIEFDLPDHTVTIKATSIPVPAYMKEADESRIWENTTFKKIAGQIATENEMELDYRASVDPTYSAVQQTEQSGLKFLQERANDAKLELKMWRGMLIVYDIQALEEADPKFTVVYGNLAPDGGTATYRMTGGKFRTKLVDTAQKATVSHVDPASATYTSESFEDKATQIGKSAAGAVGGPTGSLIGAMSAALQAPIQDWHTNVNASTDSTDEEADESDDSPESRDDAGAVDIWNPQTASASGQLKAKSTLRKKNKDRVHGEIELSIGCPLIAAGQTFNLKGLGNYDGKWYAESIQHKVGPMFSSVIQCRACLQGY